MNAASEHSLSDSSSVMSASLPAVVSTTTTENGDTLLSLSQLTTDKMVSSSVCKYSMYLYWTSAFLYIAVWKLMFGLY